MRLIRVGWANINSTVGAVKDNVQKMVQRAHELHEQGVHLAAFPEQVIGGYGAEDYIQWNEFVEAQHRGLRSFAHHTKNWDTVYVVGLLVRQRNQVFNCAALVYQGRIHGICPKEKLPTYNVFYEGRTLSAGVPSLVETCSLGEHPEEAVPFGDLLFQCSFGKVALEICEDIWSPDGPMRRRCFSGAELVVNISASPFRLGVVDTRTEMINTRSSDNHTTILYANLVGANDGLVFDGGGFVSQNGRMLLKGARFVEGIQATFVDLDRTVRLRLEDTTWRRDAENFLQQNQPIESIQVAGPMQGLLSPEHYPTPAQRNFFLPAEDFPPNPGDLFCEDLLHALVLSIGDYYEKNGIFQCIGVALSGGRDSLLCLLLAYQYLSQKAFRLSKEEKQSLLRQQLYACYMPGPYSSQETQKVAQLACEELGISLNILPIHEAFERECEAAQRMLPEGKTVTPVTQQNIQARIRATRMWNWANSTQGFFLQTSNMSEKAVGYTTMGGDMMGAFSPIANVPKTVVVYLLRYLQKKFGWKCIEAALQKPTSAELAVGQESEKELMPFPVLDACLALYAGEKLAAADIILVLSRMFPEYAPQTLQQWVERFINLFTRSIYKWVQAPLSAHVGGLDLDRERSFQVPVVSKRQWGNPVDF